MPRTVKRAFKFRFYPTPQQQNRRVGAGHERRVSSRAVEDRLLFDAHEPVQRVAVTGVAKRFLGTEMMPYQPG
ncbi:MAG TPA: helix-turn-helix domain-containing protein [Micromonosporaceae bacterium]|nr:helix-turn-helix domain-containing protein [Micromonosporaceae bacterium]